MRAMGMLGKMFSVERMLPKEHIRGEIPASAQAYRDVWHIAGPSVLEMVAQSLISSADTMMVGTLGSAAIAAVGLTNQPRMLMLAIFFAMNTGVTAIVARRKGEDRPEEANRTLRNALVLILGLTAVVMTLALAFSRELMLLAGAQPDTIDDAEIYFRILAWALPINVLTMCINAAQRGVGNTRITMIVNITSNLVNVVFNYLLIGGNLGFPRLGVAGAALATAIGFTVALILTLISILGHNKNNGFLRLSFKEDWRPHSDTMRAITKVGGNAMIEQVAMRFGFFAYARIVADLGTDAFAAHQVCMQFLNITFTVGDGIGIAGTALVGQKLGEKRPDLSMMYGKVSQRMALAASLTLLSFLIIFRTPLASLFINGAKEPHVLALASQVMIMVALFQPFQTSSVVISGCLRGAGDNRFVAVVMLICVTFLRPLLSLAAIHVLHLGLMGAWAASLVDMSVRMICVYKRFSSAKWFDIKV